MKVFLNGVEVASGGSFGMSESTTFGSCTQPTDAPTEQSEGCFEDFSDKYFHGRRKVDQSDIEKSCKKLANNSDPGIIAEICSKTDRGERVGPASEECKVTCGTCPGNCGEVNQHQFYKGTKQDGRILYKKCSWLQGLSSQAQI